MRIKTAILIIYVLSGMLNAQKVNYYDILKVKDEAMYVVTGYGKEYDEAIKYAVETYWKLNKTIKYINVDELEELKKSKVCKLYIGLGGNGIMVYGKKYSNTVLGVYGNVGFWTCYYKLDFDDLTKSKDEIVGADKNAHLMTNRVIQDLLLMTTQIKKLEEMGSKEYGNYQGSKERLKDLTILIPKECIENGVPETVFKESFAKYEVVSSDEIKKLIIEGKSENKAVLSITRGADNTIMYIMDIKTGELISYARDGERGSFGAGRQIDEDDVRSLIKRVKR
jgi:hypothetical protein